MVVGARRVVFVVEKCFHAMVQTVLGILASCPQMMVIHVEPDSNFVAAIERWTIWCNSAVRTESHSIPQPVKNVPKS
jgi:hypothetical protein